MKVWIEKDKAIVSCAFHEKELVKSIGDYKFNKNKKTWEFPAKKIIDIIEKLKIHYDEDTEKIYKKFQNKRRELHRKINKAEHIKSLSKFDVDPYPGLYHHQKQAVLLGELFGSYAFFMEMGTGKSLVSIKLMENFLPKKTLIVGPLSTLKSVWIPEIAKWSKKLKPIIMWNNLKAIKDKQYNVYIINYEQFKKLHLLKEYRLEDYIDVMIIDESSKLKNATSAITKTILKYSNIIPHRFCLTGTPAPNNLMEYFGQMAFINDDLLGGNFYKFRNSFFYAAGFGGYTYLPVRGAKEAIIERISRQAFSILKIDCLDLPPKVFQERVVFMDEDQQIAYDEMKKQNVLEFNQHTILAANELAKIMKLRQVTSGFVISNDGIPVLISETKINALKELLEEIPEGEQVIIWCQFHWEITLLAESLGGEKIATLYGLMKQKDKDAAIQDFLDRKKQYLIGHPKSGGMGLNFQHNSSYMIWYSLSYSQEEFAQACDRIFRAGQRKKCTYYLLLADKSIDGIIYKALQGKADLMNECMNLLKG